MEILYRNYYVCPKCDKKWDNVWECMCDDRCPNPVCRISVTPTKSRKLIEEEDGLQSATGNNKDFRSFKLQGSKAN